MTEAAPPEPAHHQSSITTDVKRPCATTKVGVLTWRGRSRRGLSEPSETPSVLHYTSGTTGQPKGVKHVHYSLISQYLTAKWALDLQDDDIYWCTADPGWVTGTSYGIIASVGHRRNPVRARLRFQSEKPGTALSKSTE
jgi:acyl-coenzyme A synthetase/AMP-(fatty) acid ligase